MLLRPPSCSHPDLSTGNLARTEPLQEHEIQQAGYQLAARATGNPIEDPSDLQHLAAATEVMHQTRTDLKHGRGNVDVDIEASNGTSTTLTEVSYAMGHLYNTDIQAGVALAYGAGSCDQNALINTRRYAATLQHFGETVCSIANVDLPHAWTELHRPDKNLGGDQTEPRSKIVLDSWASGPAVRLEDSVWAPYPSMVDERFDSVDGARALEAMNLARNDVLPGAFSHWETEVSLKHFQLHPVPADPVFSNVQVVNAGFAYRASEVLNAQSTFTREIFAVAAARSAYGLRVREATASTTVDAVTFEAMNLDTQTRPPMVLAEPPGL